MTGPTPIFDELRVRLADADDPHDPHDPHDPAASDRSGRSGRSDRSDRCPGASSGSHAHGDRTVLQLLRDQRDGAAPVPHAGPEHGVVLRVLSFARPAD